MNISDFRLNDKGVTYALSDITYNPDSLDISVLYEVEMEYAPKIFSHIIEIKGGKYMKNGKIEIEDNGRMQYMVGMNAHIKNSVLYFYKSVIK